MTATMAIAANASSLSSIHRRGNYRGPAEPSHQWSIQIEKTGEDGPGLKPGNEKSAELITPGGQRVGRTRQNLGSAMAADNAVE